MKVNVLIAVAAACLCAASSAQAYVVSNSSFENPTVPSNPGWTAGPITSWSMPTQVPGAYNTGLCLDSLSGFPEAPDGNQWVWMIRSTQGDGGVWQSIGTVVNNEDVEISFWLGTGPNGQGTMKVAIFSYDAGRTPPYIELDSQTVVGPASGGQKVYHTVTLNTGSGYAGDSLVIGFGNAAASGQPLLDDVSAIPEPATLALMGLGLAAAVTHRRRR